MINKVLSDFKEIMDKYPEAMKEQQKGHPFASKMRNEFKKDLEKLIESISSYSYNFRVSPGFMGNWANPPWAGIKSSSLSDKFTEGLYVIYHFHPNEEYIDLSINQGLDNIKRSEVKTRARKLRKHVPNLEGFSSEDVPEYKFSESAVLYKTYYINNINIDEFESDLKNLLKVYDELIPLYENLVRTPEVPDKNDPADDQDSDRTNYWLYAPGDKASKWEKYYKNGVMGIGSFDIGDLKQYNSKDEIAKKLRQVTHSTAKYTNDALGLYQFVNEIKPGDIIFAKKGVHEIVGYGIVKSDYYMDYSLDDNIFCHFLDVDWKEKGHWKYNGTLAMKTLTKITDNRGQVNQISSFFDFDPEDKETEIVYPEYNEEKFLEEVYITKEDYNRLIGILEHKKNLILQGAPGVGKTFISKRLAYSLIGAKDKSRVCLVQFHQSYSYEDFIMGYRPTGDGFELKQGVFYEFCKRAQDDEEHDYYFIIDEINRGNLSKIFGELFMLLEKDKRGKKNKISLLYNDELLYIPSNVYIMGMMNTADRSLAMIDYALRRRFTFYKLTPAFDNETFINYQNNLDNPKFNRIIEKIKELNDEISTDDSLGEGFMIGHSYFSNLNIDEVDEKLVYIIEYEIIPLLEEYWFDESDKVENWSNILRSVLYDSN